MIHAIFDIVVDVLADRLLDCRRCAPGIFRLYERLQFLPAEFRSALEAEDLVSARRHFQPVRRGVPGPVAELCCRQRDFKAILAFAHDLFGFHSIGDVHDHADEPARFSPLVEVEFGAQEQPMHRSVFPETAVFGFEIALASRKRSFGDRRDAFPLSWIVAGADVIETWPGILGKAEQPVELGRADDPVMEQVGFPDGHSPGLHGKPETRLADMLLLLEMPPVGHVHERADITHRPLFPIDHGENSGPVRDYAPDLAIRPDDPIVVRLAVADRGIERPLGLG